MKLNSIKNLISKEINLMDLLIKKELKSRSLNTNLGDEGGFAPNLKSHLLNQRN